MWWLALLTQLMRCWQTSGISLTAESWQPILLHGVAKPSSGPPHLGWTMYMETSTWCLGYQRLHLHSLLQLESKKLAVLAWRICACILFYDSSPILMVVEQLTVCSCACRGSHTKFSCTVMWLMITLVAHILHQSRMMLHTILQCMHQCS